MELQDHNNTTPNIDVPGDWIVKQLKLGHFT